MDARGTGQIVDRQARTVSFGGLTFTEAEYEMAAVDWHYHENAVFTLVTSGALRLGNRREVFDCPPDSLLFHSWQEPHYNAKPAGATRGFQVSVDQSWGREFALAPGRLPSAARLDRPDVRLLFYRLFREVRRQDDLTQLTIDSLLNEVFGFMQPAPTPARGIPAWVAQARELLHDYRDRTLSLQELALVLGVHWAHLSRDFPRYFRCNFGDYVRKVRVERSLPILRRTEVPLAEIALSCGFADQSHFTRCFKKFMGITPKQFRRLVQ
jgi:AraC family transcriptional regulator